MVCVYCVRVGYCGCVLCEGEILWVCVLCEGGIHVALKLAHVVQGTPEYLWRVKSVLCERVWILWVCVLTVRMGVSSIAVQHGLIGGKQCISGEGG